jgi:hypothetical protein
MVPAPQENISLGKRLRGHIRFELRHGGGVSRAAIELPDKAAAHLEATMPLATRLNVLAALLSFGFIAAIVLGIV